MINAAFGGGAGWREALDQGMFEQQRFKRDERIEQQLTRLSELPVFTFTEFEQLLARDLEDIDKETGSVVKRGQLMYDRMMSGSTSKAVDDRKQFLNRCLRIIGELNPHERRLPKLLDRKARAAVATKLEVSVAQVEEVIHQHQLYYAQWTFLRREKLRGRPVPKTNDEFGWRLRLKPTREYIEVMQTIQKVKKRTQEARPGYEEPPHEGTPNSKQQPLLIRPYLSSSYSSPERRKLPQREERDARYRPGGLVDIRGHPQRS